MKKERLQELAGLCEGEVSTEKYLKGMKKKIKEIISDPDLSADGKVDAVMKHIHNIAAHGISVD